MLSTSSDYQLTVPNLYWAAGCILECSNSALCYAAQPTLPAGPGKKVMGNLPSFYQHLICVFGVRVGARPAALQHLLPWTTPGLKPWCCWPQLVADIFKSKKQAFTRTSNGNLLVNISNITHPMLHTSPGIFCQADDGCKPGSTSATAEQELWQLNSKSCKRLKLGLELKFSIAPKIFVVVMR